ncbi:putative F-box/LRR-repeat protein At3g28410 [Brachypodium distachyon]|uniref:putative F-box/LRR-repeat protein At3g28410 n=1 Tax=Brachypodium distachyon TaxID=15368 RepID=UPI000D0D270C|nr:putative F-box/LRR-repeat protein At3g28410 [Brachypodium distachyon]|eukprot:XP_010227252.2 putative F-box/LRR-repeat protein At3g28410 [Brachypodium distachyon]
MMDDHVETEHGGGCGGGGRDRLSGLPEDLIHGILLRLGSLPAAARTSGLSRRWRHVWATLPELDLVGPLHPDPGPQPISSFLRAVDAALAAYTAPTLAHLAIAMPEPPPLRPNGSGFVPFHVPGPRVSSWLRFAAARVVGSFSLAMDELELPPCGTAKEMALFLEGFVLRLRPAGLFADLTILTIHSAAMDGPELAAFVSAMCPRLTDLTLRDIAIVRCFDARHDASIRSASLRHL